MNARLLRSTCIRQVSGVAGCFEEFARSAGALDTGDLRGATTTAGAAQNSSPDERLRLGSPSAR